MRRELLLPLGIGLAIMLVAGVGVLYQNRGSRLILQGSIQKVRTLALENASVVVADFRITNPADYPFVVRKVDVIATVDGQPVEGAVAADVDAKQLFDYYQTLGQKYNETLKVRDKLAPKQGGDWMVAARFELPEAKINARSRLVVRIEDVDGAVTEIPEQR